MVCSFLVFYHIMKWRYFEIQLLLDPLEDECNVNIKICKPVHTVIFLCY